MLRKIAAVLIGLLPAALLAAPPPGIVRLSDADDPDFFHGFGDKASMTCRLSADGRYAAFVSQARNLTDDSPGSSQASVHVRDRNNGTTQRLALDPDAFFMAQDGTVDISGNGRRVVSVVRSLPTFGDAILLQDVVDGTTLVIEEPPEPAPMRRSKGSSGGGSAANPRISTDGSVVVFASAAGLLPGVDAGIVHVYRYEVANGSLTLVSADEHGNPGNADSTQPSVSADGGRVAFLTDADNLLTDGAGNAIPDTNTARDAVVHTHATGRVRLASLDNSGAALAFSTQHAELSGNGLSVAFTNMDPVLQPGAGGLRVFVRQFDTNSTVPVSIDAAGDPIEYATSAIAIDHLGRHVAFAYMGPDPDYADFVLAYRVRDLVAATTVTLGPGTPQMFNSVQLALSANGADACLDALSGAVLPDDTNGASDVFAFATVDGAAELVSAGAVPVTWAGGHNARISADGQTVVFESLARNIVAGLPASRWGETNLVRVDVASGERSAILPQLEGTPLEGSFYDSALAADGDHIAFVTRDTRVDSTGALLRFDLRDATWTALGMESGGAPIGRAQSPSLSADGSTIAFTSDEVDFPGAPDGESQAVVWREGEATTLLSQSALGVPAANSAYAPVLDRSGTCAAFTAYNSNLVDTAQPGSQLFLRGADGVLRDINTIAGAEAGSFALSGDCSRLVFSAYVASSNKTAKGDSMPAGLWRYDIAQGLLQEIELPQDGLVPSVVHAIDASGRYIAISTDLPDFRHHLWRLDLQADVLYRISPEDGLEDIDSVAFADGGQRLVAGIEGGGFAPGEATGSGDDVYLIELPGDAIFMDDFDD